MFRAHSYDAAQQWLQRALERVPGRLSAGGALIILAPIFWNCVSGRKSKAAQHCWQAHSFLGMCQAPAWD